MTVITSTALLAGLVSAEALALTPLSLPALQQTKPVPVTEVKSGKDTVASSTFNPQDADWPSAGSERLKLAGHGAAARAKPGGLPVELAPKAAAGARPASGDVRVRVLDRAQTEKAGVDGVVLAVEGARGAADVKVDYSAFQNAYGGGWASRLTLAELPGCALTTPDRAECKPKPLGNVRNRPEDGTVTAEATFGTATATPGTDPAGPTAGDGGRAATGAGPATGTASFASYAAAPAAASAGSSTLLAVGSTPAGSEGDFTATPLAPSASWESGGPSGAFTWSYDLQTPTVPGGLGPKLALSYNSSSLDGRTAATNNQANNIGDGWGLEPGFVERRYRPCNNDMTGGNNKAKTGDLCWGSDNAVLSLGGKTSELVKDDKTGVWKLAGDDGTKVERLTDTGRGNGDDNGEYWRVTDTSGVQYYFGYHRLPGWSSGKAVTDSTWTVPVYGNQSAEPCHKSAFADSWCQQGWRWNLDYVVSPHGDAMAYYWGKETNHYGRNVNTSTGASTATPYIRGGHLKRIEYGLRAGNLYTGTPAAKITFKEAERCLPGSSFDCAESKFTKDNAKHWPDVPFDQYCAPGTECKSRYSPSFWSRKRITDITTEVRVGTGYQKVDSWKLTHQFPSTGDGSSPALWLASVTRTGHTGGTPVSLPPVTFMGTQLQNRVDATGDGIPPLIRYRVNAVNTESGGTIAVTYSAPECTPGSLPSESSNTKRCYPVFWSSPDSPAAEYKPVKDWFHTYVVTQVREEDRWGGAPPKQTNYTYLGGAAWAKAETEFAKPEHLTYADFRGYGHVRTTVGSGTDGPRLHTENRYFRGIAGADVADSEGNKVTDQAVFSGMTREEGTFLDGKLIEAGTFTPWQSAVTASRARPGLPALTARRSAAEQTETTRTQVGGGWRRTKVERAYDAHGMLATESDHGDTGKSGDESCTATTYARNTGANLLATTASVKKTAALCGSALTLPRDLISERRTYFDGSTTLGAAPTKGDVTRVDEQDAAGTGFVTVETNKTDQHGRTVETVNGAGEKTTTTFTPATQYVPTKTVTANALGHSSSVESDPGRGEETAKTDVNGRRTDAERDGLGRVVKAWEPGWTKSEHPKEPSREYTYAVSRTAPTVVTTKTLRHTGDYRSEYTFYDGLLRERETQVPSGTGIGRIISEKKYDSRGLEWKTYNGYYATGDPSPTLVTGDDTKVADLVRTEYDGAGRPTVQIAEKNTVEQRRTSTRYDGDRTTIIPPKGETATTTVKDVDDRTVELIQYTDDARTTWQSTKYTYTPAGLKETATDPVGSVWRYHYDHRGRVTRTEDPDKGPIETAYDQADRPVSAKDANGVTITTAYDALGRKTEIKQGGTTLSRWIYDSVAKGQVAKSVRYLDGQEYVFETTGLNQRYQPTGTRITIPGREGALAGTYEWTYGYGERTGQLEWTRHPALGGQAAERVSHRYSTSLPYDQVVGTSSLAGPLVNNVTYDAFKRPLRTEFGQAGLRVWETKEYDEHTGNLTRTVTDRETGPARIDDTTYAYDLAGNITRLATASGQDQQKSVDTQCFTTDALRRITNAWTATDGCAAKPNADGTAGGTAPKVGGPDAYWHSFTYDPIGNRKTEVQHKVAGDVVATKDITRTYGYGENGAGKRALTSVTSQAEGEADAKKDTYGYDKTGNTTSRKVGASAQDLIWDAEGRLAKVVEGGRTTEYGYDPDGNRVVAKDATGTTLYLPAGNELKLDTAGKMTGTRHYVQDGKTVATKVSGQTSVMLADHHGTATVAVLMGMGQAVTRRKQHVFGGQRVAQPSHWPGSKGFVGGTADATGLTHLGAREYDPTLGRFISVDPVMDTGDPQQMHGYTYGNNNPLVYADPDGKFFGSFIRTIINLVRLVVRVVMAWRRTVFSRSSYFGGRSPVLGPYRPATTPRVYGPFVSDNARAQAQARADAAAREAQRKADEQRARENDVKKNTKDNRSGWQKFWDGTKETFGTWDGWKNRVLPAAGFATCVIASAGVCGVAGVVSAGVVLVGDRVTTGEWDFKTAGKSLAWTAVGTGAAIKYAQWGGATLKQATWGSAISRTSVVVKPATTTSGAIRQPGPINWAVTRGNSVSNANFALGFCGAGPASPGLLVGSC
ncbi:RHS repeat protein [Streptomyces sp. PCS3-D2]|uniref:RHS repeat domain-containing protein n=1 Tax=Streptomyces sp. PCS3-D2 TaxID=1460244 RepID=UPI00044A2BF9|nr:RHS repeat-associated core domain-containing protein [Streptomyces sp. PCS3-D2]WKV74069.1 RHS repeat protein [Streptomyces sp. PCS3-D2]